MAGPGPAQVPPRIPFSPHQQGCAEMGSLETNAPPRGQRTSRCPRASPKQGLRTPGTPHAMWTPPDTQPPPAAAEGRGSAPSSGTHLGAQRRPKVLGWSGVPSALPVQGHRGPRTPASAWGADPHGAGEPHASPSQGRQRLRLACGDKCASRAAPRHGADAASSAARVPARQSPLRHLCVRSGHRPPAPRRAPSAL